MLAFQRGDDSDDAFLGALMWSEFQAYLLSWGDNWVEWAKAWAKTQKRKRRR